jgi:hypothetical protein
MTYSNSNAITGRAMKCDPNKHITYVTEVVVQTHYDCRHPRKAGNNADEFDGQWIVNVIYIFRVGSDSREGIAGL